MRVHNKIVEIHDSRRGEIKHGSDKKDEQKKVDYIIRGKKPRRHEDFRKKRKKHGGRRERMEMGDQEDMEDM